MPDLTMVGTFLAAVASAYAAILGGVITWRKARGEEESADNQHLDHLFERQTKRIENLEGNDAERVKRERALINYIFRLQLHIVNQQPPPPPPWPKALLPEEEE